MNDAIMKIIAEQYDAAVKKHPEFPSGQAAASIIAEELGELARELNDAWACHPGAQERALIEAAHVAVTAIRTMEMLAGTEKAIVTNGDKIRNCGNMELACYLSELTNESVCPGAPGHWHEAECNFEECKVCDNLACWLNWLKQEAKK